MKKESYKLTISTPQEKLFEGEVLGMSFSSEGGDMEVFSGHAALTATLAFSPLVLHLEDGGQEEFVARNGLVLFDNKANTATVLALHAELKSSVSKQTIEEYIKFIEEQLAEGKELSEFQIKYLEGEKLAVEKQLETL